MNQETLRNDMKAAMKSKNKVRLSTIRLIMAGIKNAEIEKGGELDNSEVIAVLNHEARKRKEAIEEYQKAGRQDLSCKEQEELDVISGYLPEQMSEGELRGLIDEIAEEVGATSSADFGKVMGAIMPRVKGKADGRRVNELVREMLSA